MQFAILIGAMVLGAFVLTRLFLAMTSVRLSGSKLNRRADFADSNAYSAVSIQPAENVCSAMEALKAQRFLSDYAPELPLPECAGVDCGCKYVHHSDRRSGARDRRRDEIEGSAEHEFWQLRGDRRFVSGRRQDDLQLA